MKTKKDIDPNNISTSGEALVGMVATFALIWGIIQMILMLIFGNISMYIGIIIFLVSCIPLVFPSKVEVEANQALVLLNRFTGKARAVFQGTRFKLFWEIVAYTVDLEAEVEAKIRAETFSTKGGGVLASADVLSKVDSAEGKDEVTRSKHLLTYVRNKPEVITGMLAAKTREKMREFFKEKTLEEALAAISEQILDHRFSFKEPEEVLSVDVKETSVFDIDPTKEAQNARDSRTKGDILKEVAQKFVDLGVKPQEAMNFAALLNKDIPVEKKIQEINISGLNLPEPVITLFAALAKKFGGTK